MFHLKKKQQNQATHFQQHAVDDDGDVDDAFVGQVEDGQATKELVWVAAFPRIKKTTNLTSRYYLLCVYLRIVLSRSSIIQYSTVAPYY